MPRWAWVVLGVGALMCLARRPVGSAVKTVLGRFTDKKRGEILLVKLAGPVGVEAGA